MTECGALIGHQRGKETNACLLLSTQIKYFFFSDYTNYGKIFREVLPPSAPSPAHLSGQLVFYLGVLPKPGNFTTFLLAGPLKNKITY